jgi:hypothetical protein
VDKISLPFRILLVVILLFAVVWFVLLRPKPGDAEPAAPTVSTAPAVSTAPGVAGLTAAEAKAKKAVAAANAAAARQEATANAVGGSSTTAKPSAKGVTPATPATPAVKPVKPVKPGLADDAAPGDPSRPLLASVDAGKVVVLLFWNKKAADDRATREGLRKVDLHHGKVVASAVPLAEVGRYEAITRGAQVLESPTVLVIGAGGKARAITGYTQAKEIDQAVSDIGGKGFEVKKAFHFTGFSKVADETCKDFGYALAQKADPPTTVPALSKALGTFAKEEQSAQKRIAKVTATTPAERKLKSALIAWTNNDSKWIADARSKLKNGAQPADVFLALSQLESDGNNATVAAAKKLHLRSCYADD